MKKDCLSCKKFITCRKKKKGPNYKCDQYIKMSAKKMVKMALNDDKILQGEYNKKDDKSFLYSLKQAVQNTNSLIDDPRFNDSHIPLAPNYYEWMTDDKYIGNAQPVPWARQFEIGLKINADVCWYCDGGKEFWTEQLSHKLPKEYFENLPLMQHGICPQCNRSRLKTLKHVPDMNALTLVCGQRSAKCLVGNTIVRLPTGWKTLSQCVNNSVSHVQLKGQSKAVAAGKYSGIRQVVKLTFDDGRTLVGTPDHRIEDSAGHLVALQDVIIDRSENGQFKGSKKQNVNKPLKVAHAFSIDGWNEIPQGASESDFDNLSHSGVIKQLRELLGPKIAPQDNATWHWPEAHDIPMVFALCDSLGIRIEYKKKVVSAKNTDLIRLIRWIYPDLSESETLSAWSNQINPVVSFAMQARIRALCYAASQYRIKQLGQFFNNEDNDFRLISFLGVTDDQNAYDIDRINQAAKIITKWSHQTHDKQYAYMSMGIQLWLAPNIRTVVKKEVVWQKQSVYDIDVPDGRLFNANGIVTHNSVIVTQLKSYIHHRMLKLGKPSAYFEGAQTTILHALFSAYQHSQAVKTLYEPYYELVTESNWFKNYHGWLDDIGQKMGRELYKLKDTYMFYANARLNIQAVSPNKRATRGRTTYFNAIDELGMLSNDDQAERASGTELVTSFDNSLQTLRSAHDNLRSQGDIDVPPILLVNVSSPLSVFDPIMTFMRLQQKDSDSRSLIMHYPTWKMNPKIKKKHLGMFKTNPKRAWRDFGARPPMSTNAFFETIDDVIELTTQIPNAMVGKPNVVRIGAKTYSIAKPKWNWDSPEGVPRLMTLDGGSTDNSFALCVSHFDTKEGKQIVDCLYEIIPSSDRPIGFSWLGTDLFPEIIERLNVKLVFSDGWQNKKILADIEAEYGCIVQEYTLKYSDFVQFRDNAVLNQDIYLPALEMDPSEVINKEENYRKYFANAPVAHFMHQCVTVVDKSTKVDKGIDQTDDLFRCVVMAYTVAQDPQVLRIISGEGQRKSKKFLGLLAKPGVTPPVNTNTNKSGKVIAAIGQVTGPRT